MVACSKIVQNGEGSAFLTILTQCRNHFRLQNALPKDNRCKDRLGGNAINYDIPKALEDAGVDYITVHGRTRIQGYSGEANYDAIAKICSLVKIPVIGNGDVVCLQSLENMRKTGVSGVSLARGALGKPWIFSELKGKRY